MAGWLGGNEGAGIRGRWGEGRTRRIGNQGYSGL